MRFGGVSSMSIESRCYGVDIRRDAVRSDHQRVVPDLPAWPVLGHVHEPIKHDGTLTDGIAGWSAEEQPSMQRQTWAVARSALQPVAHR
jgi:hypothetical protein